MNRLRHISFLLLACALAACASLTFDQRLQDGYDLNVSVRTAVADAVNAGKLSSQQGREALEITDNARALLDTAAQGNERGLDLALEVLQALDRGTP